MPAPVEFLFDLGSPYSYLASTQLEAIERRTGAAVRPVPVVLGAVFKALGGPQLPHGNRLAWMRRDMAAWAHRYQIPFAFPDAFPTRTILGQRVVLAAAEGEARNIAMRALFNAYWGKGHDIADPIVVNEALVAVGLDGAALVARADEPAVKDALRANTEAALARGVFGVPTFFVGDELFFGNDRIDFVEAAIKRGG